MLLISLRIDNYKAQEDPNAYSAKSVHFFLFLSVKKIFRNVNGFPFVSFA